jgi:hypothetical protein
MRPQLFHISDFLDKHIENIHRDDEDRTLRVHVTDVTSKEPCCVFNIKTGRAVEHRENAPGVLRRFEAGHKIEELTKEALFANGWKPLPEDKVQMEWPDCDMVGTPDIVALDPNGVPTLIEVKSISTVSYTHLTLPTK